MIRIVLHLTLKPRANNRFVCFQNLCFIIFFLFPLLSGTDLGIAQESYADYRDVNLPFKYLSGPSGAAILEFKNSDTLSNFNDELYQYLLNKPDINEKYILYPLVVLKDQMELLKLDNLNPEYEDVVKALKNNLGIKFLFYGEVVSEKNKIVSLSVKDTETNSVIFQQTFESSINSSSVNDIYLLLTENKQAVYSPVALFIVETEPDNAVITIGGKEYISPDTITLNPGKYSLQVTKETSEPLKDIIELKPGQILNKFYPLQQIIHKFKVYVYPPESRTVLKRNNSLVDSWDGNKTLEKINAGKYTLTTSLTGYQVIEQKIYLNPGTDAFNVMYILPDQSTRNNIRISREDEITELYKKINNLDENRDYLEFTAAGFKILSIDPTDRHFKMVLGNIISEYTDEIVLTGDLLENIFTLIDETSIFPLQNIISNLYKRDNRYLLELLVGKVSNTDSLFNLFRYFYELNDEYFMTHIIGKLMYSDSVSSSLSADDLFTIDPNKNPNFYRKYIEVSPRYLLNTPDWQLAIIYYIAGNRLLMNRYLEDSIIENNFDGLSINHLMAIDPGINTDNFTELFKTLYSAIPSAELSSVESADDYYVLAKQLYAVGDITSATEYLTNIYNSRQSSGEELGNQIKWGIGALVVNDTFRAEKIFDNIYVYGKDEELSHLRNELSWWKKQGFQKEFLNTIISRYFESN